MGIGENVPLPPRPRNSCLTVHAGREYAAGTGVSRSIGSPGALRPVRAAEGVAHGARGATRCTGPAAKGIMTSSGCSTDSRSADHTRRMDAQFFSRSAIAARRGGRLLLLGAAVVAIHLLLSAPASAVTMVDCNTPDDFCKGNPCVTHDE